MNVESRTIFRHDNLEVLQGINSECIDLIYLDPPFNKKKIFTAPIGSSAEGANFKDIFTLEDLKEEWIQTIKEDHFSMYRLLEAVRDIEGRTSYNFCYLSYMGIRLIECHRVLKDTGSLYLHCDPTMSHYLKLLMDCIFGEKGFKNEIVWYYFKPHSGKTNYPRNYDTILFYTRSKDYTFNHEATLFQYDEKSVRRYDKTDKHGRKYKKYLGKDGVERIAYLKSGRSDNVFKIPFIQGTSKERTGYPTQKPLALLERIIKVSSNKGDVVLDPFCGCATTCVASEKLERRWIGIDVSIKAYELVQKRIHDEVYKTGLIAGDDMSGKAVRLPTVHFSTTPPTRRDTGGDTQSKKYVYVISHKKWTGEYKVGIASNVKIRLSSYQTSDPNREFQLEYAVLTSYYRELEQHMHDTFTNKHEWVQGDLQDIIHEMDTYKPIV